MVTFCGAAVLADELTNIDVTQKSPDTTTLDYMKNAGATVPMTIPATAKSISIYKIEIIDNWEDNNVLKTLYRIGRRYDALTEDEYKEVLNSGYYQYWEYTDSYVLENYGVSTVEELIENYPEEFSKLVENNPKIIYDEYLKTLKNPFLDTIKFDKSGYTLQPVEQKADNTVTKYTLDKETFALTPQEYRIDLKQTSYGTGDTTKYFEWSQKDDDTIEFTQVQIPTTGKTTISYSYNDPLLKFANNTYSTVYENQSSLQEIEGPSLYYKYYIAAPLKVNEGEITSITNTLFKDNTISITPENTHKTVYGGALYNKGTITNLNADFVGNSIISGNSKEKWGYHDMRGGALYNAGSIEKINGNFINNSVLLGYRDESNSSSDIIYNIANIGSITGNFINNKGTPIGNIGGKIGNINGNFIGNTGGQHYYVNGLYHDNINHFISAIYNSGGIENISGTFIGNNGEVIHNGGEIHSITGDFIGNGTGIFSGDYNGGNIMHNNIDSVMANFIGNKTGIEYGKYSVITGDFIGNTFSAIKDVNAEYIIGDFIRNGHGSDYELHYIVSGNVKHLAGDFIENKGQISGTFETINGNFIGNNGDGYSSNDTYLISGNIGDINANFYKNTAGAIIINTPHSSNGAYYDPGYINSIKGDFIENTGTVILSVSSYNNYFGAGPSQIGTIEGNFINNTSPDSILNFVVSSSYPLPEIHVPFVVFGEETPKIINSLLLNNTSNGPVINAQKNLDIIADNGLTVFSNNNITENGESISPIGIYLDAHFQGGTNMRYTEHNTYDTSNLNLLAKNNGKIIMNDRISGVSNVNTAAYDKDGAIIRYWLDTDGNIVNSLKSSSKSEYDYDKGGEYVYTNSIQDKDGNDIKFYRWYKSSTYDSTLRDRIYTYHQLDKENNEIKSYKYYYKDKTEKVDGNNVNYRYYYMLDDNNNVIKIYRTTYNSKTYEIIDENNKVIGTGDVFSFENISNEIEKEYQEKYKDAITTKNYQVNIDGDATGVVELNNNIEAVSAIEGKDAVTDISLSNTQLHLGVRDNVLDNNNLYLNSGLLNTINGQAGVLALNKLIVKGNTNMVADVDLANQEMDRFTANEYGNHTGKLNVSGLNLVSDAKADKTDVYFAQPGLKNNVSTSVKTLQALSPIYKYDVKYENRSDAGYFVFNRGAAASSSSGGSGNVSDGFNPAVLSSPVTAQAGANAGITETFRYVFEHADAFTQLPSMDRMALMKNNRYALSTDYNNNLGALAPEFNNKAGWARPYVTFENMHLKNGPKVDAITYGTLVGYDTDFHEHKHGWNSVGTGYIGYNGSQLSYKGVDTTMNGGLLGYTHTMYKGNFWTALTASAGASVGQSTTMYGKEDFTSLLAGIGSKTGYNFEFKEGKYILQPIMFMSYTFVNTFDYTNAAGVKIESDPMHSIQLNPSIRFIANTKTGWQPYASVGMVWNLMNETNSTANGVKLPEMHTKPYVEYGVGLQKRFKDKFTAFGQAMLRNGGRNGIALTAGFRWALGKDGKPIEKVQNDKKVIPSSTVRAFANAQNDKKEISSTFGRGWHEVTGEGSKISTHPDLPSQGKVKTNSTSVGSKNTAARTVLKQLTPQQKTALGVKPQNTTRTTNIGVIK